MQEQLPKAPRRRGAPTKPVTIRFDVQLRARLEQRAPRERRSVGNLLQKLVADGLDRLDDEDALREATRKNREILAGLPPHEVEAIVERQRALLARQKGAAVRLPPLPPSLRRQGRTRRKTDKS